MRAKHQFDKTEPSYTYIHESRRVPRLVYIIHCGYTPVFKIIPIAPFQRFIKGNFQGKNDVIEEYLHVYCFLRDFSQKNKKIVLP